MRKIPVDCCTVRIQLILNLKYDEEHQEYKFDLFENRKKKQFKNLY